MLPSWPFVINWSRARMKHHGPPGTIQGLIQQLGITSAVGICPVAISLTASSRVVNANR